MKKWFWLLLGILLTTACGAGTEVVNPPQPNQAPRPLTIEAGSDQITLDVPASWALFRYDHGEPVGPEALKDTDPQTLILATLVRQQTNSQSKGTLMGAYLTTGQSFEDFIRLRHPLEPIVIETIPNEGHDPELEGIFLSYFTWDDPQTPRRIWQDVYINRKNRVIILRFQFEGTGAEIQQTLEELVNILDSIRFI